MNDFKYFIKLQKAYQEGGDYFVQGVASGVLEDRDSERMSEDVLKSFAEAMPMPLTDAHPERGPILGEIGQVIYATILDDENRSLFIKAKLDTDHPAVPYMIKQLEKGKKFAFSIEGTAPVVQEVWSDRLGKMINEYVKVVPKAISITTEPSYIGSFLEVVSKAYNKSLKNNLLKDTNMKKEALKTETEQTTPEVTPTEVTPVAVEEVAKATGPQAVAEADKVPAEDKKENPLNISDPTVEKTEGEDTLAQIAAIEAQLAVLKQKIQQEDTVEEVEMKAETEPEVAGEKEPETPGETEPEAPKGLEAKVDALAQGLQQVIATLNKLVTSDEDVHAEIGKSTKENLKMMKAFYDEITGLPLQKRSLVKAKTVEEIIAPKTFKDIAQTMLD